MKSLIIPAYNEEKQVTSVVRVALASNLLDEVIVVDDGSKDNTATKASEAGATVIRLPKNQGKGAAMMAGIQKAHGEIIVFLDADLLGLNKEHLINLIGPVESGEAEMTIGDFHGGNFITFLGQTLTPAISGQRAIKREAFKDLDLTNLGYGVELALNKFAKKHHLKIKKVKIYGLNQVLAEQKMGFIGFTLRFFKYLDIVKEIFSD